MLMIKHTELVDAGFCLAISEYAAHERCRGEVKRAARTLDQLTEALNHEGFELKQSPVYCLFQPYTELLD